MLNSIVFILAVKGVLKKDYTIKVKFPLLASNWYVTSWQSSEEKEIEKLQWITLKLDYDDDAGLQIIFLPWKEICPTRAPLW